MEFLEDLCAGVDIEIVVAALPEAAQPPVSGETQRQLAFAVAFLPAYPAGEPLLEDLDDSCWRREAGFAEQQMHVLGHEHETDQCKVIARTHFLKNFDGQIPGASGAQQRPASIAAEGDEMQVPAASDAFQMMRHKRSGPPFEDRKG